MIWRSNFLAISLRKGNSLDINFLDNSFKQCMHWLKFIASQGDAVFMTPKHPNYKGDGSTPTYYCHKHFSNTIEFHKTQWESIFLNFGIYPDFSNILIKKAKFEAKTETKIIEFSSHDHNFEEASEILKEKSDILRIMLADPNSWATWNSSLASTKNNVLIVTANSETEWPVTMKIKDKEDSEMQFAVRSRTAN
jgi:hypothetical protein